VPRGFDCAAPLKDTENQVGKQMDILDQAAEKPKDDADVRVGRRVRALRLERNLSLAELAAKAGVSIGALSQIERGLSSLRVKVIWPLAAALDIEPSADPGEI
jgi:DNA-binding XRE family transcriptional regulator